MSSNSQTVSKETESEDGSSHEVACSVRGSEELGKSFVVVLWRDGREEGEGGEGRRKKSASSFTPFPFFALAHVRGLRESEEGRLTVPSDDVPYGRVKDDAVKSKGKGEKRSVDEASTRGSGRRRDEMRA